MSGLKKEVKTHGAPSDLTTRNINLQETLVDKEKALNEAHILKGAILPSDRCQEGSGRGERIPLGVG